MSNFDETNSTSTPDLYHSLTTVLSDNAKDFPIIRLPNQFSIPTELYSFVSSSDSADSDAKALEVFINSNILDLESKLGSSTRNLFLSISCFFSDPHFPSVPSVFPISPSDLFSSTVDFIKTIVTTPLPFQFSLLPAFVIVVQQFIDPILSVLIETTDTSSCDHSVVGINSAVGILMNDKQESYCNRSIYQKLMENFSNQLLEIKQSV
ncbi:hypothetical protein GEMRC1_004122 [Eukaryota sp. GEM-RC1]